MPPLEVPVGRIALAAGALAAIVLLVVGAVLGWLHLGGPAPRNTALQPVAEPALTGPRLQSAPQLDLQAYRAEKAAQLDALGWVDTRAGIARIPIDDAMALLARQAAAPAPAASGASTPQVNR